VEEAGDGVGAGIRAEEFVSGVMGSELFLTSGGGGSGGGSSAGESSKE
jgi:hypothetical protein